MKAIRILFIFSTIFYLLDEVITAPTATGDIKEITRNVYAFSDFQGFPLNSMFIVTSQGVIAIEPFNSAHSRKLIAAIRTITNEPIKYLLISHNHYDHAAGGKVTKLI